MSEITVTDYEGRAHFNRLGSFEVPVNASDILVFCTEIMKELFSSFACVWLDSIRRHHKFKKQGTYDDIGYLAKR